ncbi:MAG: hypothetical protein U1C18_01355, partial [Patescibacteria group bacterium]|nr:hypothetical protein [Patescibacteria group bacterium]
MSGLIPYILVRSGSLVLAYVDMREPMHFSTGSGKQMVSLESLMAHPTACTGYFAKCCIAHLVASRCRLAISYEGVAGEQAASRLVF